MSERDELLAEIERLRKALNETWIRSSHEMERLASDIAHDLREPLHSIGIMSQLLTRKCSRDDIAVSELGQNVMDSVRRVDELLKGLVEYAHETSTPETERVAVDLNAACAKALDALRESAQEYGATFSVQELPTVEGHEESFVKLFQELLANALKFRRPGLPPMIRVTATQNDSGFHTITVDDNGIGFDPARASKKLFRLFKRLHGSEYEGLGLGLAACKRIVQRYGGDITAESEPGQGTRFSFTLPVMREQGGAAR